MPMTKTLVWIGLLDPPLHFWSVQTLEAIGNKIGKFLKIVSDGVEVGPATFACICLEVDLSLGFSDKITLIWNNSKWIVKLHYQNKAFRCHICQQTKHL